jgi:hypothetical protein
MSQGFNPFIVAMPSRQERRREKREEEKREAAGRGSSQADEHDHLRCTNPEQDYAAMRAALQQLLTDISKYIQDMQQNSASYTEASTEFLEKHEDTYRMKTELVQKMHEATANVKDKSSPAEILEAVTKTKQVSLQIIRDLYKPLLTHSEKFFTQSINFHETYDRMGPLLQSWHDNIGKYANSIDEYSKYHDKKLQDQVDFQNALLQQKDIEDKKEMQELQSKFHILKDKYKSLITNEPQYIKKIDALKEDNNNRKTTIVKMGINYLKMHRDLQHVIQQIRNPKIKAFYEHNAKYYAAHIAKFPSKWLEENADLKKLSETQSDEDLERLDQAFENLATAPESEEDLEAGSR